MLVLAPHPDDESIACGGLLLAARDAGAARRVITFTDGDNNPWPQRWVEKRWRIDAAARARWGARRRAESGNALDALGVAANERVFLGYPDTALTSLILRDTSGIVSTVSEQFAKFKPTLIAFPVLADRHPDHSAVHIAARLASLGIESSARLLAYRVHGEDPSATAAAVGLSDSQREIKRNAIASHRTQMVLSGKRFLAFARQREAYEEIATVQRKDHPLGALVRDRRRVLELRVRKQRLHGNRRILVLLGESPDKTLAWHFSFSPSRPAVDVHDARDDRIVMEAEWHDEPEAWKLVLPLPADANPRIGFAKLSKERPGLVVFDRYGWQVVDVGKSS